MESSLPILAATDKNTDIKDVLVESGSGFWCESGDLDSFINYAKQLSEDEELRAQMGSNSRIYLEKHYDITKTIDILLKHL
jgi:glycosyltransferase involved in cell wall biosynthesis